MVFTEEYAKLKNRVSKVQNSNVKENCMLINGINIFRKEYANKGGGATF